MEILTKLLGMALAEAGPEPDPRELSERVLRLLMVLPEDQVREALMPVVLPWVKQSEKERARARELEKRAFEERPASARHGNPAQDAMRRLLLTSCYVPGHGLVPWGQMTSEYHQLRIKYLEERLQRFTEGTRATIRRHEFAAGLLEESGCADLEEYAAEYGELPGMLTEEAPAGSPAKEGAEA
jgi:cytochrome c553